MVRGNGAKYFPVDNAEMDTLIEGLDPPNSSSTPPTTSTATFARGSTFEQNYTTLGDLDSMPPQQPPQPSTSRSSPPQTRAGAHKTPRRLMSETDRQMSYSAYYSNPEQEENIKCVVSSLLFVGIVLLVLVIAFVYNPQMA